MLFNSLVFVVFFLAVYGVERALPHRAGKVFLLVASWFFYAYWDWRFLGLLVLTTVIDFLVALRIADPTRRGRRVLVAVSVGVNLGVLVAFKYLGFFLAEANAALEAIGVTGALPVLRIAMPMGLSFYTFQSMAYTLDVYRGRAQATRSFVDFALFVAFFPQLVAGPIGRARGLLPQLAGPRKPRADDVASGLQLIILGYFKKVFVADNLAMMVDQVFDRPTPPGGFMVLLGAWAFAWQIYCDFSGYTDIARGLARLMGVHLAENFRNPFFATSPRDLWHRWHISLSEWLRDFLYIPLGGNRRGAARTRFSLLATMVLGGLWHGASWTFVAWGAYHGLALVLQRALPTVRLGRWTRPLAILAMFQFTSLGFMVFRAHSLGQVGTLLCALARAPLPAPADLVGLRLFAVTVTPLLLIELAQVLRGDPAVLTRLPRPAQALVFAILALAVVFLGASSGRTFIYFQF